MRGGLPLLWSLFVVVLSMSPATRAGPLRQDLDRPAPMAGMGKPVALLEMRMAENEDGVADEVGERASDVAQAMQDDITKNFKNVAGEGLSQEQEEQIAEARDKGEAAIKKSHEKAKEKLKAAKKWMKSQTLPSPLGASINCATLGPLGAMVGMIGAVCALLAKDSIPANPEQQFLGYVAMMAMVTFEGPYFLSTVACNPDKFLA